MDPDERNLRTVVINSVLRPHLKHKPDCATLQGRSKECNCGLQKAINEALDQEVAK